MVLTSASAVMASLVGLRSRSSTPAPDDPPGAAARVEDVAPLSAEQESPVTSEAVATTTTPSCFSVGLVMVMFWAGVMVGVVVSGLAAFRLYTVNMAEREERMVQELLEQEARMEQEKQDRFWLGLALASLISVFAVVQSYRMKYAEREACAKNQQRLKNLLVERMSRKEVAPAPEEEQVLERLQCVVCLGAAREVILLDCGHVCTCRLCADTLLREDHLCPVCRSEIRTVKPAFIS